MSSSDLPTQNPPPADISLEEAANRINRGELVGFPTETVYGLGADATNSFAVSEIFKRKGRPSNNPLIVHTNSIERLAQIVTVPDPSTAPDLSRRFKALTKLWPGPLTIVLKKSATIASNVTNNSPLVGVRIPAHELALRLLALCNNPVAAPSANRSNRVSPTSAVHVLQEFNGEVPVLDGGDCELGIESTVVEPRSNGVIVHRPGYITVEQIEQLAGPILPSSQMNNATTLSSPGQLALHYAPVTPCYLLKDLPALAKDVYILGLTKDLSSIAVQPTGVTKVFDFCSLAEFAGGLYRTLRLIDEEAKAGAIAFILPEPSGLGLAICDRLSRATHR